MVQDTDDTLEENVSSTPFVVRREVWLDISQKYERAQRRQDSFRFPARQQLTQLMALLGEPGSKFLELVVSEPLGAVRLVAFE